MLNMESSGILFKNKMDKAFTQPGIEMNKDTMADIDTFKKGFSEEKIDVGTDNKLSQNNKDMVYGIVDIVKKVEDMNNRKTIANDMIKKFKRENIKFDYDKFLEMCGLNKEKKSETKEATGSGSSGAYSAPLFSGEEPDLNKVETKEQRRKTMKAAKTVEKDTNDEGNTFKVGDKAKTFDTKQTITIKGLSKKNGRTMAFYMDGVVGREIDIDGLDPIKEQVEKVEAKEATTSGSVGGYETPSMWAKSTKKKDWGPSRKTQIPGGGFVKVKKKCTKFPYCNQGDINALKITKNESVIDAIKSVSKKTGISENMIKSILEHEYEKVNKRHK